MATSTEQKKAIELGRLIAARFSERSRDEQTVRWMAYYIAEQITRAENATGEEKVAAEKSCFDTILALWTHRHEFPHGHRPFEEFESIIETLTRIDPENPTPYYFNREQLGANELTQCLGFIEGVDRIARALVSAALSNAATQATSPDTKAFLDAKLGDDRMDANSVAAIMNLSHYDLTSVLEEQLTEQIANLGKFVRLAGHLRTDLEARKSAFVAKRTHEKGPAA
jgi:hypothetical protein